MKGPCYGCGARREGCHGMCQRYKAYRLEMDIARGVRQRNNVHVISTYEYTKRVRREGARRRRKENQGREALT